MRARNDMLLCMRKAWGILLAAPLLSLSVTSCSTAPDYCDPLNTYNTDNVATEAGGNDEVLTESQAKKLSADLKAAKPQLPTDGSAGDVTKAIDAAISNLDSGNPGGSVLNTANNTIVDYFNQNCTG